MKRRCALLLLLTLTLSGLPAADAAVEMLGERATLKNLQFEGNVTFTSAQLHSALRRDLALARLGHPLRAGGPFFEALSHAVAEGYRNAGFAEVVVEVQPEGDTGIIVRLAEGPRYRWGGVRLQGESPLAAAELEEVLQSHLHPETFQLLPVDHEVENAIEPIMPPEDWARTTAATRKRISGCLRELIAGQGYPSTAIAVDFVLQAGSPPSVDVQLVLTDAGPGQLVSKIVLAGCERNDPEMVRAVLQELGLQIGSALTYQLQRLVLKQLRASGSFLSQEWSVARREAGAVITITVHEHPDLPLLQRQPSPAQQAMTALAQQLEDFHLHAGQALQVGFRSEDRQGELFIAPEPGRGSLQLSQRGADFGLQLSLHRKIVHFDGQRFALPTWLPQNQSLIFKYHARTHAPKEEGSTVQMGINFGLAKEPKLSAEVDPAALWRVLGTGVVPELRQLPEGGRETRLAAADGFTALTIVETADGHRIQGLRFEREGASGWADFRLPAPNSEAAEGLPPAPGFGENPELAVQALRQLLLAWMPADELAEDNRQLLSAVAEMIVGLTLNLGNLASGVAADAGAEPAQTEKFSIPLDSEDVQLDFLWAVLHLQVLREAEEWWPTKAWPLALMHDVQEVLMQGDTFGDAINRQGRRQQGPVALLAASYAAGLRHPAAAAWLAEVGLQRLQRDWFVRDVMHLLMPVLDDLPRLLAQVQRPDLVLALLPDVQRAEVIGLLQTLQVTEDPRLRSGMLKLALQRWYENSLQELLRKAFQRQVERGQQATH